MANGWLFRDLQEVWLWRQSNRLVSGEKIWEAGKRRDPAFTTANLFWWYNMGASHDFGVTPRPIYKSDGRKLPDCYSQPLELRDDPAFNDLGILVQRGSDLPKGLAFGTKIPCQLSLFAHITFLLALPAGGPKLPNVAWRRAECPKSKPPP